MWSGRRHLLRQRWTTVIVRHPIFNERAMPFPDTFGKVSVCVCRCWSAPGTSCGTECSRLRTWTTSSLRTKPSLTPSSPDVCSTTTAGYHTHAHTCTNLRANMCDFHTTAWNCVSYLPRPVPSEPAEGHIRPDHRVPERPGLPVPLGPGGTRPPTAV